MFLRTMPGFASKYDHSHGGSQDIPICGFSGVVFETICTIRADFLLKIVIWIETFK